MNAAERLADDCGLPVDEYLRRISNNGVDDLKSVAAILGVSIPRASQLLHKYGVVSGDKRAFEWRGATDTIAGHCRRSGISACDVRTEKCRNGLSGADALDIISDRQSNRRASGINPG